MSEEAQKPVFKHKENGASAKLISYCGLYCGACKKYLKKKCTGCHENVKATWCKIRECCMDNGYKSCADCNKYHDLADCKKLNNFMSMVFALFFRSDRRACLARIKKIGYDAYAREMAEKGLQAVRK